MKTPIYNLVEAFIQSDNLFISLNMCWKKVCCSTVQWQFLIRESNLKPRQAHNHYATPPNPCTLTFSVRIMTSAKSNKIAQSKMNGQLKIILNQMRKWISTHQTSNLGGGGKHQSRTSQNQGVSLCFASVKKNDKDRKNKILIAEQDKQSASILQHSSCNFIITVFKSLSSTMSTALTMLI